MAWIESHQELARHPKTRKAARLLGTSVPAVVGHLHCLWHWALDWAPYGDLTGFDVEQIADAGLWDGDAQTFVDALVECGVSGEPGYLEQDGACGPPDDDATG